MAEILKQPIEIIIKDFVDQSAPDLSLESQAVCKGCGQEKICPRCENGYLEVSVKPAEPKLETPESVTIDLEQSLSMGGNVKLWRPDNEIETPGEFETNEGETHQLQICKIEKPKEVEPQKAVSIERKSSWSDDDDFILEDPKSQGNEIEVQADVHTPKTFDDNNNQFYHQSIENNQVDVMPEPEKVDAIVTATVAKTNNLSTVEETFSDNNKQYDHEFDIQPIVTEQVDTSPKPQLVDTIVTSVATFQNNISMSFTGNNNKQLDLDFDYKPIEVQQVDVNLETEHVDAIVSANLPETKDLLTLTDDFRKTLTISEQIVEGPANEFGEPLEFTESGRKPIQYTEWSDIGSHSRIPFKNNQNQSKKVYKPNGDRIRPRPGYFDLDRPSYEEENSYDAVNWKSLSPEAKVIKKMNDFIQKSDKFLMEKMKENVNEIKKPEEEIKSEPEFVDQQLVSPQPSETSKSRNFKRNIPLPRPIRKK